MLALRTPVLRPIARAAAQRAACWLIATRPFPVGWGFNASTGPDADSTAHVLLLLKGVGFSHDEKDVAWLFRRWQSDGGFATYDRSDAWGESHPDVTPVAYRALPAQCQRALLKDLIDFLRRTRRADCTWPAYWWRNSHYSTFHNLELIVQFDLPIDLCPPAVAGEDQRVDSAFDLCFILGIAHLFAGFAPSTREMLAYLLAQQSSDGRWPGAPNLRVTDRQVFCAFWDKS
jgi:hypothetical protein